MPSRFNKLLGNVPAYNEETCLRGVVEEIGATCSAFDDDGSTNGTSDEARAAMAASTHAPFNLGTTGAMQCGYVHALDHGYGLAVHERRGRHDAGQVPLCREYLDLHMITDARFLEQTDGDADRSSAPRRVGICVFAGLFTLIIPLLLHFSLIKRPADQTKVPPQRLDIAQHELDDVRAALDAQRDRNGDWEHVHS